MAGWVANRQGVVENGYREPGRRGEAASELGVVILVPSGK